MNAILSFLQKLNSHQPLMPKCSRICQCQQMEFHSQQRKRTGRSQGYGQTFKDFKLRERKVERTFMAEYMRTHGSTSSSGIQIVVGTRGQRHPQLTSGRRRNMTALFLNTLPNLISAEEVLKDVLITKIELPEFFHEMLVHWRATGNAETDQNIAHRLRSNAKKLHKQMQENFYGIRLPVIKFVPDRQHLNIQEMESHFRSADYGENYQAVCNVAVPSEPLPPNDEKSQKPPWWLENWRRRVKTSQKEEKPMTAHTDAEENDTKVAALIAAGVNKELT